jgi:peptidoglycan/xylan/chitin deacetylase (PgdA/CDA1 family)
MRPTLEIAAFAYHDVTDDPAASGFQRPAAIPYKLPVEAFRRHLDAIADRPDPPVLVTATHLERGGRHLLLTIDDGGRGAITVAEELDRRGWKGHFFVTTSRLGSRGFVDEGDIRALHAAGHLVGSHSHTHPNIFRDLADDRMRAEWRDSCRLLEEITATPTLVASVPGGDMSESVCRSAAEAGLRYLFTSDPLLHPRLMGGCWIIGRYCVKVGTDPAYIRRLARFQSWGWALMVRRVKDAGRLALPGLYRAYVRHVTREDASPSSAAELSESSR